MKQQLLILVLALFCALHSWAQPSKIQLIHNVTFPGLVDTVDVYFDNQKIADNLLIKHCTGFLDIPSGVAGTIHITMGNSTSPANALFSLPMPAFTANMHNILTAYGEDPTTAATFLLMDVEPSFSPDSGRLIAINGVQTTNTWTTRVSRGWPTTTLTGIGGRLMSRMVRFDTLGRLGVTLSETINGNEFPIFEGSISDTLVKSGQNIVLVTWGRENNRAPYTKNILLAPAQGGPLQELSTILSLQPSTNTSSWLVYPNPSANWVTITADVNEAEVTVTDMKGAKQNAPIQKLDGGSLHIQVADLPAGLYQVSLRKGSVLETRRFLKQ